MLHIAIEQLAQICLQTFYLQSEIKKKDTHK